MGLFGKSTQRDPKEQVSNESQIKYIDNPKKHITIAVRK